MFGGCGMAKTGPKRKYAFNREKLDEMYQRMSLRDIAKELGCGETLVWNRVKEFGITFKAAKNGRFRPRVFTEQHRKNMGMARRGKFTQEKSPSWRGGVHAMHLHIRASGAYKSWKLAARKRANNRCESCGVENKSVCPCCGTKISLHVHHIKQFAKFPVERFDPENSEVLCPKCHNIRHNGKIV
jgi:transposase